RNRVEAERSSTQPDRWMFITWPDTPVIGWTALAYIDEMINPGQSKAGFAITSPGLPAIVSYQVQGNRAVPRENGTEEEITTEEYRNDIFSNSVQGFAVGPRNPSLPFDSLNFIDTLKGFMNQSRSLNWITSQ